MATQKERLLEIVQTILREPTAPFHESYVREAIAALLAACPHIEVSTDPFGNLIAHYSNGSGHPAAVRKYALCAHMDHPGWVQPEEDGAPLRFLGGVPAETQAANRESIKSYGPFAMWDLPECELREERIYSRACDDLIGCATIVAALERIEQAGFAGDCYGLFTRAEEVGFGGAIEMARSGWLAKAELTVISLETSAERPPAKMGDGPIVRVGDKTSIFDGTVTAELAATAAEAGITVQRCLMSGGTCEATPFRLYGVRCGALCVALGNYHNCAPDRRIDVEFVSVADVEGLVALCAELITRSTSLPDPDAALRTRLENNLSQYTPFRHRDQPAARL